MAQGTLIADGTIDLAQFWPTGSSDADTVKLLVASGPNAIRFRPRAGRAFKPTRAFAGASVVGRVRRPAIDATGHVVIRLQGVDAPELHYRPVAVLAAAARTAKQAALFTTWCHEYRQPIGESATVALARHLGGSGVIRCSVTTAVDTPNEVFDTYGRLVGDVFVRAHAGRPKASVNEWLLSRGWAFPSLYSSMSAEEIERALALARPAAAAKRGAWKWLARTAALAWDDVYMRHGAFDPKKDHGPVIDPKLFRRLCTWAVNARAKMEAGSFEDHLVKHPDGCYETKAFLAQGITAAPHRRLSDFVTAAGKIGVTPGELVFQEAAAELVIGKRRVVRW